MRSRILPCSQPVVSPLPIAGTTGALLLRLEKTASAFLIPHSLANSFNQRVRQRGLAQERMNDADDERKTRLQKRIASDSVELEFGNLKEQHLQNKR